MDIYETVFALPDEVLDRCRPGFREQYKKLCAQFKEMDPPNQWFVLSLIAQTWPGRCPKCRGPVE